ncbi:fimbrial protein domain-containing protein [[Enterobacter] lignolyticus]|uniref:Fimbrial protein domain-containing protein n=1 Tax=Enterobacter lignolyticus (strain SCF1) TaxID=701347 RepID=E3GCA4_ENTLS|nr:fimbrial protein domain-containing protein [[Enterobacter] lignolyticus]ADO48990.1 Fimbrial protein domain-containing protein [[Enterobacter] lignolyticus SCF1]
MKTLVKFVFPFVCLSSALFSAGVQASSPPAQGGVIHFVGQIVEDPCDIATSSQAVSLRCMRNGKVSTTAISYQQAEAGTAMSNNIASISMHYLNPQHTLATVIVDYK